MDDLLKFLGIDKGEWLEGIEGGNSSSASIIIVKEKVGGLKRNLTVKLN